MDDRARLPRFSKRDLENTLSRHLQILIAIHVGASSGAMLVRYSSCYSRHVSETDERESR